MEDLLRLAVYLALAGSIGTTLFVLVPYFKDEHGVRDIPGPLAAHLSNLWLAYWSSQGKRSEMVHEQHLKCGKLVRIAPNHISVNDPDALPIVYGHGTGTLKSEFYDAFVSIQRGLFNTRSRTQHTRKRKIVSHVFSQKNVLGFEPNLHSALSRFVSQWDRMCAAGVKGGRGNEQDGWHGDGQRVWMDCLPCAYNYLAFDIIGDLAFGSPFGMLDACADSANAAVGGVNALKDGKPMQTVSVPAIRILNERGEFSATMGVLAPWMRPLVLKLPWFARGLSAVRALAGLAIAAVGRRLAEPSDRNDLLAKLQDAKDDDGMPMGPEELTAEALTQLIAGSDTTSNSSCAIAYYVARYPRVQLKLQQELDAALPNDGVTTYEQVKRLPYLTAVINEGLRLHSTSAMGLPRIVPEGGLTVAGRFFTEGSILSVPSYTIHRDPEVWGEDFDKFRPERWSEGDQTLIQKTFNPFSWGPRACVGRNLAMMELLLIVSTTFRRYHLVLESDDEASQTREGFLRKPVLCRIGLKRRSPV
ncbi:cytochrome P450 monooxygenase pc-bph [Auricularia subglabra TFB-10046 SS5]|uniref:Cytochrome P450 monooxygenase pc-bph n=1 Tax=Auricularia subglabra (strain TFB-10046 / SS5) TaxID=717982 RepID=J0LJM1_AURST|nr:cytochrome P450 monooxygenase pc-bph [Auricularia subglabra TFB-10046 SS5]